MASEISQTLTPVIEAFAQLSIPYAIGGSVASSALGIARSTLDADLVVDLKEEQVDPLAKLLQERYYLDVAAMKDAVRRRASFNLIFLETMIKVDVFILGRRSYDQQSFPRRKKKSLSQAPSDEPLFIMAAEDVIINKLEWYRMGGEISERQWGDILGILKVQNEKLDYDYLGKWAREIEVLDLLDRALNEVQLR